VDGAATPPKASPKVASQKDASQASSQKTSSPSGSTSTGSTGEGAAPGSQQTSRDDTSTPAADTKSDPSEDSTEATEASASDASGGEARGPRYELKAFKKWTEENPEQAAELAKAVFQIDVDEGFIKLQNKARRIKGEIREQRTAAEKAAQDKLAAAQAAQAEAEQIAGSLRYMADMWGAAQRKDDQGRVIIDFDTADECFRQNMGGISIDDYMRQRARRGVSSPELARERASRLRLEAELAQLKGNNGAARGAQEANGAAASVPGAAHGTPEADKPAAAPAAPTTNPEELWGDELPKTHQLREFRGWADELHREMQRHYDETLDEYSVDPEEIADKLLQRKIAAFQPEEQEPAPARRAPAKKPNTPKNRQRPAATGAVPSAAELTPRGRRPASKDDLADDAPADYVSRERWALDRAQRRLRGEAV
jgi:hypothetical protein